MDFDLGRVAQSSSRRHTGGGRARQGTPLQKGNAGNVAVRKSSSLKALRKTSQQKRE